MKLTHIMIVRVGSTRESFYGRAGLRAGDQAELL